MNIENSLTVNSIITIEYCPKCGWMLRAAYMAQELLSTFTGDIKGVMLRPSETSGTYTVFIDNYIIFDRKTSGRFPEMHCFRQKDFRALSGDQRTQAISKR
jgi:selenoprotein W-related protein